MPEPKVVVYPGDNGACGHYRCDYPAIAVAKRGHDVHISRGQLITDALVKMYADGPKIISAKVPDVDIAVFQRPSTKEAAPLIRYYQERGIRVVVELDDNFDALLPSNQAWWAYRHPDQNVTHLRECIKLADRVVVSTPALAAAYRTEVVMENCIPSWYFNRSMLRAQTVGWAGSMAVHKGDLSVVGTGLRDAMRPGWEFTVIGESDGVARELCLPKDPPETGWVSMSDYLDGIAGLGIGIAPLAETRFNLSKSWLKPLEYAAVGTPCVASNLEEYRRLGIGMLATKPKQWKWMLAKLMEDEQFRDDLVAEQRVIAEKWTYEARAEEWWEAWTGA